MENGGTFVCGLVVVESWKFGNFRWFVIVLPLVDHCPVYLCGVEFHKVDGLLTGNLITSSFVGSDGRFSNVDKRGGFVNVFNLLSLSRWVIINMSVMLDR